MTALADKKSVRFERWKHRLFTLKAGQIAYSGGLAMIKQTSAGNDGKVYAGPSASGYILLGVFDETVDASSAGPLGSVDQPVNVDLLRERTVLWRANDGTIVAADVGSKCYVSDDNTVSLNSTTQSVAGMILAIDATYGVAFEVGAFASEV